MSYDLDSQHNQQSTESNHTDVVQKKIDPVEQQNWINNHSVDQGWGIYGNESSSDVGQLRENDTKEENNDENDKEPIVPKHGVTNKETNLTLDNNKIKKIPSETPLFIIERINKDEKDILKVGVVIKKNTKTGYIDGNDVNITPNNIMQIKESIKKNIIVGADGIIPLNDKLENINIHYSGLPEGIKDNIDEKIFDLLKVKNKLGPNTTISSIVDFNEKTKDNKYAGKSLIFRFTRFNNGNKNDIVIVEELGEYIVHRKLEGEAKADVVDKIEKYNITFIEATDEEEKVSEQLKKIWENNSETGNEQPPKSN